MSDAAQITRVKNAANALVAGSVTQSQSTEVIAAANAVIVDPITPTGPTGPTAPTGPTGGTAGGPTGTWSNLVSGTPFDDSSAYWTRPAINPLTMKMLIPGFQGRTGLFDFATGLITLVAGSKWANAENYGIDHDGVSRFWLSAQAPSNGVFAPTGPLSARSGYFSDTDPGISAANTFTPFGYVSANGQVGFAQGYHVGVGSWSVDADGAAVTRLSDMVKRAVTCVGAIPPPAWGGIGGVDWQKQAAVDTRNGKVYVLAPDHANGTVATVYRLDDLIAAFEGTKSVATWVKLTTPGTVPPLTTVIALDEGADTIVGYCGVDQYVDGGHPAPQTGLIRRTTYLLPLSAPTWSTLPVNPAMPAEFVAYHDLLRNPAGGVVLTAGGSGTGCRIWGLKIG